MWAGARTLPASLAWESENLTGLASVVGDSFASQLDSQGGKFLKQRKSGRGFR